MLKLIDGTKSFGVLGQTPVVVPKAVDGIIPPYDIFGGAK